MRSRLFGLGLALTAFEKIVGPEPAGARFLSSTSGKQYFGELLGFPATKAAKAKYASGMAAGIYHLSLSQRSKPCLYAEIASSFDPFE